MKQIKEHSLLLIVGLLVILALASCKKEQPPRIEPAPVTPAPKGPMEGSYAWYAGDSATADLIFTTFAVNCSYCSPQYSDVYTYNLFIPKWSYQSPYLAVPTGTRYDSLQYATENGKVFYYVRR